jgi:hypothetical protein
MDSPQPLSPFCISDFVDRTESLKALWQLIRQEVADRILLVVGPELIGKTYLLEELLQECQTQAITIVRAKLGQAKCQSYLEVIDTIGLQLGGSGFSDQIGQALSAIDQSRVSQPSPRPDNVGAPPGSRPELAARRVGGIDINAPLTVTGNLAGRDYYQHFIQIVLTQDDPVTQTWVKHHLTEAFQRFLQTQAAARGIVFLFDEWESVHTDTGNWLCDGLLNWIVRHDLPATVAVIACPTVPEHYDLLRYRRQLVLPYFEDDKAREYWKLRGCPPEKLPEMIYARLPGLLLVMAKQYQFANAQQLVQP